MARGNDRHSSKSIWHEQGDPQPSFRTKKEKVRQLKEATMSSPYFTERADKIIGKILKILFFTFVVIVCWRVFSLLTAWPIYSWLAGQLMNEGAVPEYLASAIAILAVGFLVAYSGTLFWAFIKGKKWVVIVMAVAFASLWLFLYAMQLRFASEELFNGKGKPMAAYVTLDDGTIKKVPLGWKVDKETGLPAKPFDAAAAKKYREQKAKPVVEQVEPAPPTQAARDAWCKGVVDHYDNGPDLCLEISALDLTATNTVLHLVMSVENQWSTNWKLPDRDRVYLVDQDGYTYNHDSEDSNFERNGDQRWSFRQEEVHRTKVLFLLVRDTTQKLKLYIGYFPPFDLTPLLADARARKPPDSGF